MPQADSRRDAAVREVPAEKGKLLCEDIRHEEIVRISRTLAVRLEIVAGHRTERNLTRAFAKE